MSAKTKSKPSTNGNPRHRYTDSEKFSLLRHLVKGTPLNQLKRELGVSRHTLRRIREEALESGKARLVLKR